MEFTCERGDLYGVLGSVQSVVPGRSVRPVLSNVLISASEGGVEVMGTDMDISIVGKVNAKTDKEGAFALPARRLFNLLRELSSGEVHFKKGKNRVEISQGAGRFYVGGVEKEDYPAEDIMKGERTSFKIARDDLKRIVMKTSYAISSDIARVALSGLFMKMEKGRLVAVATDGHRLTLIKKEMKIGGDVDTEIIVPMKTVGHLIKMVGETDGEVTVELGEGTARFIVGALTLTTKLINERFPNYEQVIPHDNDKIIICDRSMLISATKRVSILSNSLTHLVKFAMSENRLELTCSDYDVGGEAYEELPIEYSGDSMVIGFGSNDILDVLQHFDSDEVKFLVKNSLSSVLLMPFPQDENEEYLSILMPLRLPEEEG
ncbi:DNA polymerase III subunit beta [bacterium]|nr:DNA polymerase III subunit beta [bacterium]